jgi:hypothetical protein
MITTIQSMTEVFAVYLAACIFADVETYLNDGPVGA